MSGHAEDYKGEIFQFKTKKKFATKLYEETKPAIEDYLSEFTDNSQVAVYIFVGPQGPPPPPLGDGGG